MEGDKGGTTGSSRWNPTKEQINLLEGLYEQGVRTPSADQIQQITARLREYGTIEGKNVFYWFQNHKARQRQKQKQESIAYFNRLLHRTTRLLYPPPSSSILGCGPYYVQKSDAVSCPQPHHVLLQTGCRKKQVSSQRSDKTAKMYDSGGYNRFPHQDRRNTLSGIRGSFNCDHENSVDFHQKTLTLFPLQPTVMSRGSDATVTMEDSDYTPTSSSLETCNWHQPFFDFFPASNESCDS